MSSVGSTSLQRGAFVIRDNTPLRADILSPLL